MSLITGFIGIFLPVLPTTPFVILTCWCYGRGSPKLHSWIIGTRIFGPLIREWEETRSIPLHAKIIATVMITTSIGWGIYSQSSISVKIIMGSVGIILVMFILTRPSRRNAKQQLL